MKRNINKKVSTILSVFLFSITILLSVNAFAADKDKDKDKVYATQADLTAEINARDAADTDIHTTEAALQAAIDAQQGLIEAQQAALEEALEDIAKLKEFHVPPKNIGDHFGGGIVFYVDVAGQHGLIAALDDHINTIQWYNGFFKDTGATGDGVGAGASNTSIIVAALADDNPGGNFAARVAADYSVQDDGFTACTGLADEICIGDWYLPSKHELDLLYQQKDVVGGFASVGSFYWSSTEADSVNAWYQVFNSGDQGNFSKINPRNVRAVRAF